MKKLIGGLLAVGIVLALRPLLKRRMVEKMREHCKQMMGQFAEGGETMSHEAMCRQMREHCEPMTSHRAEHREPVATA